MQAAAYLDALDALERHDPLAGEGPGEHPALPAAPPALFPPPPPQRALSTMPLADPIEGGSDQWGCVVKAAPSAALVSCPLPPVPAALTRSLFTPVHSRAAATPRLQSADSASRRASSVRCRVPDGTVAAGCCGPKLGIDRMTWPPGRAAASPARGRGDGHRSAANTPCTSSSPTRRSATGWPRRPATGRSRRPATGRPPPATAARERAPGFGKFHATRSPDTAAAVREVPREASFRGGFGVHRRSRWAAETGTAPRPVLRERVARSGAPLRERIFFGALRVTEEPLHTRPFDGCEEAPVPATIGRLSASRGCRQRERPTRSSRCEKHSEVPMGALG
eukprot:COSAG04_NODE_2_length_56781_cov_25.092252_29_plen_337_part_00